MRVPFVKYPSARVLVVLTLIAAATAMGATPASAQLVTNKICAPATAGGGKTCTATAMCGNAFPVQCTIIIDGVVMSTGVASCSVGTTNGTAMAMHNPSSTTPSPTCQVFFAQLCRSMTTQACAGAPLMSATVTIDAMDGLPVELMDFSVEQQ